MNIKQLLPALTIVFANSLSATIIIPVLPLYTVERLGGTVFQAIILGTFYYIAKLITSPLLGRLSDYYGRRPLLIISQGGTIFSFILFVFALPLGEIIQRMSLSSIINGGVLVLYIAHTLDGATAGNNSIAQAYIADVSAEKDRAQAFGLLSAAVGVGYIFGPAVGGLLAVQWGLLAPFICGAVMAAIALTLTVILLPETLPQQKLTDKDNWLVQSKMGYRSVNLKQILKTPSFISIFMIGFLGALCFSAFAPTFALYVDQVLFPQVTDPSLVSRNVGMIFTLVSIVIALTQIVFIKPLIAYLGEAKLIMLGQFVYILACLVIPLVRHPIFFTMALLPFAFAYGISEPSLQALLLGFGERQTRGQLLGIYQSLLSMAFILGPLWAGYIFQNVSPQAMWWVGGLILLPAFILSLSLSRYSIMDIT